MVGSLGYSEAPGSPFWRMHQARAARRLGRPFSASRRIGPAHVSGLGAVDVQRQYQLCLMKVQAGCKEDPTCVQYYTAACFAQAVAAQTPAKPRSKLPINALRGFGDVSDMRQTAAIGLGVGLGVAGLVWLMRKRK